MAHSYSRSGGAPTELQHPPPHGYEERREQPLTLPPISAPYPPPPGHYDPRYDGKPSITLPSIHPHPPHPSQHPQQYQQYQGPPPPQHYPPQQPYRTSHEGNRPSHETHGYHPYPQSERPLHLQQPQTQKYATLPSEPYVPSRMGDGHGRAHKKISQRRGERGTDDDRSALLHKTDPSYLQSRPALYANAQSRPVVASQPQHTYAPPPRSEWSGESSPRELQQAEIRKRSTSGESGKMLSPGVPNMGQYLQSQASPTNKMDVASVVSGSSSSPSSSWIYTLTMRQQPLAARACGFGERDRRVIDPPPILELKIDHPTATDEEKRARLKDPYYVVHCSLWSADHDVDNSAMDDTANGARGSGSGQRRLMGTLVSSPFVGKDENGVEGCFFCFPDLSCRTTGRYRLKFNMVSIDPQKMMRGDRRPFEASIISGVVIVYAAKDFPGMSSSSKLTRRLKEQGCLISVKKGIERVGEKSRKNTKDEEENDDDEEGTSARGGR